MPKSNFMCNDTGKRGYCTCAGTFNACDCAPASTTGAPTSCTDCGADVFHRRACGKCETHPCACHPLVALAERLWGTAAMAWSPPLLTRGTVAT